MPGGPHIEALKALVAHNQSWADWSTFVVFIGLLGEIAITFAYTKDKPRSEIVLGVICGVVIAVGVYGGYKFGSNAAQENTQLQNISDRKVAELNKEAADARKAAGAAEERAANIEQRLADRHISVEQGKKLLSILRVRPGTNVRVDWLLSSASSDALAYAREIADVFHDARWNVVYPMSLTSSERPQVGVSIEIKNDSSSNGELRALVMKAFKAAGIPASEGIDPNLIPPSVIEVLVGSK